MEMRTAAIVIEFNWVHCTLIIVLLLMKMRTAIVIEFNWVQCTSIIVLLLFILFNSYLVVDFNTAPIPANKPANKPGVGAIVIHIIQIQFSTRCRFYYRTRAQWSHHDI